MFLSTSSEKILHVCMHFPHIYFATSLSTHGEPTAVRYPQRCQQSLQWIWNPTLGCIRHTRLSVFLVYLSLTNTEPLTWCDSNFQTSEEKCSSPSKLNFSTKWNNLSLRTVSVGSKSTAWHVEALLLKVTDASRIQIVWKGLWGLRSLSRYSIFDLCNFTPVKIQRTGRFQNVNVVYHSHHNAHISCFRTLRSLQNPMHTLKRMIPSDILGILDFPGRWNYLWPICQVVFAVCSKDGRNAASDTAQPEQTHVRLTSKSCTSRYGDTAL